LTNRLLLRPNEAAELLAVGRSKLYELIAAGEVPSMKIGKSLRVPAAALERWVAERAASAGEDDGTQVTTAETLAGQRK
jgi:excisionase family DNA binding protein